MLDKIIQYSLNNRLLVMMMTIIIIFSGVYIFREIDVDIFPDLNAPTVVVMTEATGMAPEEVEQMVTFPIETAVNGASGIRRIRSASAMGYSIVWVEFNWNVDVYDARQTVAEKLSVARERMPASVGEPVIAPQSSLLGEVVILAISSDTLDMRELRTFAEWTMRPRLITVGGVAQITVHGGENMEYQILPDPHKMEIYGISLEQIQKAGRASNDNASGGFINEYGKKYTIRGVARTLDLDEMGQTVLTGDNGQQVSLSDVAEIKVGSAPQIGKASYLGKEAVAIIITKQPEVNTVELTERVREELAAMAEEYPQIQIHDPIYEQADFINLAINNVKRVLLEGSVFVFIILFLFLFNIRTTVISLISIPVSLLLTFIALKMMGLTVNTMSLGGMAIAIGSLVDDAIIDVENVYRRLREERTKPPGERQASLRIIFNASREIRSSIMNATLIIIIAFLPLFFLSGFEGRMLKPLGIAYIFALTSSLIVALTLTPVLCSYLLTKESFLKGKEKGSWVERNLGKWYKSSLAYALYHKKLFVGFTVLVFAISVFLLLGFGRNFLPPFNEGSLTINLASLPEISLDESDRLGTEAERLLLDIPEVSGTLRKTGRAELAEHTFGDNVSEIDVPFELKDRSRAEFLEDVRKQLKAIPGAVVSVGQPISHRIDHLLSGSLTNIAIKLFGSDLQEMYETAKEIERLTSDIDGVADFNVEQQVDVPQIIIRPKRALLAAEGITVSDFNSFISASFNGEKLADVFDEDRSTDLVLRLPEEYRSRIEDLGDVLIDGRNGKVPLSSIADIKSSAGPTTIQRENVRRKLVISVNVAGRDVRSVVNDINARVKAGGIVPQGIHIEYGGQFESEERASRILLLASLLAILLIFVLLYQEFRSTILAGIILLNLPLALIGGVFAILLTSGELSIPAIIGFITLFGIATRNGLLLISKYRQSENDEGSLLDRIIHSSADRLNPILMTALTAALALIPLAMAGSEPGNEIQSPMAQVILGGLITSTFLNIYFIPIVYYILKKKGVRNV